MELSLFISKTESMEESWKQGIPEGLIPDNWKCHGEIGFTRLYFGQEFCERLIPSVAHLDKALDFARKNNANFTLVTPFVTESGLDKWENIIEALYSRCPDCEIVINDLGILGLVREKFPNLTCVLGRLLTKQKRGPQILRLEGKVPDSMIDHFRRFNADVPKVAEFYRQLGFTRIELDNTLQGIVRDNNTPASLYFPYLYVSTTRMCLTNQSDDRKQSMRAIFPCKLECQKIHFTIEHEEIPVPVILAGNTQFIYNKKLPPSPEDLFIDRLVYEPDIPI